MNKETDFDVLEINYSQLIGRLDIKDIDDRTKLVYQILDTAEIEDITILRERLHKVYLEFGEQSIADFWARVLSFSYGSFRAIYRQAVEFSEVFAQSISESKGLFK